RQRLAVTHVAFQLELHQAIERNRHKIRALDVDAELADVPGDDGGEARGAALVFPGQPRRQVDDAALRGASVSLARRFVGPHMLRRLAHGCLPDEINSCALAYQGPGRVKRCKQPWWV